MFLSKPIFVIVSYILQKIYTNSISILKQFGGSIFKFKSFIQAPHTSIHSKTHDSQKKVSGKYHGSATWPKVMAKYQNKAHCM